MGVSREIYSGNMAQVSARMAAALARQTPKAASLAKQAPTMSVAARQFSATASNNKSKAALSEISSILEERILGAAPAANLEETGRVLRSRLLESSSSIFFLYFSSSIFSS